MINERGELVTLSADEREAELKKGVQIINFEDADKR
jgi:hypothetical protein